MSDTKKNIREQFCYYIESPTLKNRRQVLDEACKLSAEDRSAVLEMLKAHPVSKRGPPRNGFKLTKRMTRCIQVHTRVHGGAIPDIELTTFSGGRINLPTAPAWLGALVTTAKPPTCQMDEPVIVRLSFTQRSAAVTGVFLDLCVEYEGIRGFGDRSFEQDYYHLHEDVDRLRISNPALYWHISGLDLTKLRAPDYAGLCNLLEPLPNFDFQIETFRGSCSDFEKTQEKS